MGTGWSLGGCSRAEVGQTKKECPVQDKTVWATVLALVWLHSKMADKKVEWQMLARKATAWLKSHQQGWSADDVVGKACSILGAKRGLEGFRIWGTVECWEGVSWGQANPDPECACVNSLNATLL
ncbi:von Willebrand factor A domain-containing protein 5A [Branchiostoma belcheri]|nr:von Willebrand factor A domain-containing protein 5A [Branchiostoma belcheri]